MKSILNNIFYLKTIQDNFGNCISVSIVIKSKYKQHLIEQREVQRKNAINKIRFSE